MNSIQNSTAMTGGIGAAPVVYGQSDRPPRGDYERAGADYTCAQNWAQYTEQDHDTFRRLYQQQLSRLPGLACDAFLAALPLTVRIGQTLLVHASADQPERWRYVEDEGAATRCLDAALREMPDLHLVACGHVHHQIGRAHV